MRMRKLGHGQSIMFFAPIEIDRQIRTAGNLSTAFIPQAADVIRWAMLETCADIEHHIPHWAQQGVSFHRRSQAYATYLEDGDNKVLANGWLAPESRSLEELYGYTSEEQTNSSLALQASEIPELNARLKELEVGDLADSRMDEEQEREVSHEMEREQQVERPPKMEPAGHYLHLDVRSFIRTGIISKESEHIVPLLSVLPIAGASAATFATSDFIRTVPGKSQMTTLSDYMRPVHWVVSSRIQGTLKLVVLSPFEVNALLPQIRESKVVHLHVYTPRATETMRSFSDLTFFTLPPLPIHGWSPPTPLIQTEINLWAGQLYLDNYDMYKLVDLLLKWYVQSLEHG
jgi:hypothetical protein